MINWRAILTTLSLVFISAYDAEAANRFCSWIVRQPRTIQLSADSLPLNQWFHYRFHENAVGLSLRLSPAYNSKGELLATAGNIRVVMGSLKLGEDAGISVELLGTVVDGFKGGAAVREYMDENFRFSNVSNHNGVTSILARRVGTTQQGPIPAIQSVNHEIPDYVRIDVNDGRIIRFQYLKKRFLRSASELFSAEREDLQNGAWNFQFDGLTLSGDAAQQIIDRLEIPPSEFYRFGGGVPFRSATLSDWYGYQIQFDQNLTPVEIVGTLNGLLSHGIRPEQFPKLLESIRRF